MKISKLKNVKCMAITNQNQNMSVCYARMDTSIIKLMGNVFKTKIQKILNLVVIRKIQMINVFASTIMIQKIKNCNK